MRTRTAGKAICAILCGNMRKTSWPIRSVILTVAFLGSGLLFIVLLIAMNFSAPQSGGPPMAGPPTENSWAAIFGLVATGLTSLTTLAGLILNLQKDRREGRKSDLEARRLELELERADLELDTLRKERAG